jgi:cell wall-associated NlpC family hydrolase
VGRAQLGSRYVWGAEGPATFDCSGLTSVASARSIPLVPGDLVFFADDPGSPSTIHLLHLAPQLRRRRPPRP